MGCILKQNGIKMKSKETKNRKVIREKKPEECQCHKSNNRIQA